MRARPFSARQRAGLVIAAAVVIGAVVASGALASPTGFRGWLADVRASQGLRGWDHLGDGIRRSYGGDLGAYLAEVEAVDWGRLRLGQPRDVRVHDGFAWVQATLISEPASVPRFLFERGILHGICDGLDPVAVGAWEDRRPFADGRLDVSGETGGQARCNDTFRPAREPGG